MATNKEIIKKHSLNPNGAVEQMDCSLDTLMNEVRTDERQRVVQILNDLWEKEGKNIDSGVYAYPFEALRDMIIKEIARRAIK